MIKFITNGGSLEVKNGGEAVLLFTPMKNIAFTSLELYEDIPTISLYNINVGLNERLFSAPLSQVADNDGTFFTVDSFLTYASLNFGMTPTESSTPTPTDGITFKFPIQSGQTIAQNDFVQLSDSGEIFEVASTGTVPITMPIGSGAEYSQTLAPNQDRDNLVRFVDNAENFILFFCAGYNIGAYFQGGSVDDLGNFTYRNSPILQDASARYIEFDIDETTFGQPVVKGCCSYVKSTGSNLYGKAFEYTVATQTFVFGAELDFGSNLGDNDTAGNITNVGSGKYILFSTRSNVTFIATVSNLAITKQANTTIPSNRERGHFVKISNDKVIWVVLSINYNTDAYIFDISGNVITVGNKSTSTWNNFNFSQATRQIDSDNRFYMCMPSTMGGNPLVSQQTYDSVNDIVVFNNNRLELNTSIFVTDISYNPTTNIVIVSGSLSSIPSASIINFTSSSIINKTVGVSSGSQVGMGINSQGDVVFNYNNANKGTTSYGTVGDILSNLDPEKTIGVASDSLGNVEISGSVITNSSLDLTINSKVYVDGTGVISTTKSDGAISIGFAITTTSFILTITR